MAWTDEQVEQLRQMWIEGLSANEIAKKLGVSKNSIVGKVHRLCLKARPSPIKKKNPQPEAVEPKKEEKVAVKEPKAPKVVEKVAAEEVVVQEKEVVVKEPVKMENGCVKLVNLDSHTCRWPIGDPRDEDFCFCGKRVRTGQTYCDEHSAVAYVKAQKK